MSKFRLVRVDFRLIHGQVITKWLKHAGADKIVIVDDTLAQDEFMRQIYTMSAPAGIDVDVHSIADAMEAWNENNFGSDKILLLIRDVNTIYTLINDGLPVDRLQIGGLGAAPDRKKVYGPISLNQDDYDQLKSLNDSGVEVVLHQVPDEPEMQFNKIKVKF